MACALGRHALIIEDEILIAIEVESLLEGLGFETFDIADNPAEAVACARARRPDLITADVRIIGGTGIEAVNTIEGDLGPIPHIYVTGNVDMLKTEAPAEVIDKPIMPAKLAAACERACRGV